MIEPTNLEISKSIDKSIIHTLRQEIEYFDSSTLASIIHEIVGTGFVCDIIEKCAEWED